VSGTVADGAVVWVVTGIVTAVVEPSVLATVVVVAGAVLGSLVISVGLIVEESPTVVIEIVLDTLVVVPSVTVVIGGESLSTTAVKQLIQMTNNVLKIDSIF